MSKDSVDLISVAMSSLMLGAKPMKAGKRRDKFRAGDHLVVSRGLYSHHGIYAGNGHVIHYSGFADGLRSGPVVYDTLKVFANGEDIAVRNYESRKFSGTEAVRRAETRLGEDRYDVHSNNCEDFCSWAITGKSGSEQVEFVEDILGLISPMTAAAVKLRKHATREQPGGVGGDLTSTAATVALMAVTPVTIPAVVAGKAIKWIFK